MKRVCNWRDPARNEPPWCSRGPARETALPIVTRTPFGCSPTHGSSVRPSGSWPEVRPVGAVSGRHGDLPSSRRWGKTAGGGKTRLGAKRRNLWASLKNRVPR